MENNSLQDYLSRWSLTELKFNLGFLEAGITFNDYDKDASWEMYVELLTRITTQHLNFKDGDEKTALDSVYSIFSITRGILKHYGRECINFTKISVVVLNQVIRPFTAKWHKVSLKQGFEDEEICTEFRNDLKKLQEQLKNYTRALADIAKVEDLTNMEEQENGSS